MIKRVCLIITTLIITACGVNNDVSVSTIQGACPSESYAPYCMSVTVQNNSGGQNWINSTNFPINDLTMTLSGATNVASPATNTSLTDPNNCINTTISPGESCTFYFMINAEAYAVQSQENINTTLSYTVNNTLFGGSDNTYTSSFTVNQNTNLYIMGSNAVLWIYNSGGINSYIAESTPPVLSIAADNTQYGLLYLSTNNGVYSYGLQTTSSAINPSQSGLSGVNNLFTFNGSLYAASTNTNAAGIWSYSLSGESWNNGGSALYQAGQTVFANNVNTVSTSSNLYLSGNGGSAGYSNIVYDCSINTTSTGTCATEGRVLDEESSQALVYALGYGTTVSPLSGLYAGTSLGLFAEIGSGSNSNWIHVSSDESQSITNSINSIVVSANGALYAGDQSGNIWVIDSKPLQASKFTTLAGASITKMILDVNGNMLYFIGKSTSGYGLYSCSLESATCSTPTTINTTAFSGVEIVGLAIASQLSY